MSLCVPQNHVSICLEDDEHVPLRFSNYVSMRLENDELVPQCTQIMLANDYNV